MTVSALPKGRNSIHARTYYVQQRSCADYFLRGPRWHLSGGPLGTLAAHLYVCARIRKVSVYDMAHHTAFIVIACIAIASEAFLIFLALFAPGLRYKVTSPSSQPLDSED